MYEPTDYSCGEHEFNFKNKKTWKQHLRNKHKEVDWVDKIDVALEKLIVLGNRTLRKLQIHGKRETKIELSTIQDCVKIVEDVKND